jgi:UDPglucose 6-dehydrogenase
MKIAIIGYGFVGQALYSVLKKPENTLLLDPNLFETTLDEVKDFNPDLIFLCVPTPTVDGRCDDSIVLDYVKKLKDWPGCLVIKSTIPPTTVERVLKVRPSTVVWPELLREAHAQQDIQWPNVMVVGAPSTMHFEFVEKFIKEETKIFWNKALSPHIASKARHVTPVEASIFKYTVNTYLAMKTIYFHQMKLWMNDSGRGESFGVVTKLLGEEGRIGQTHMEAPGEHGFGFAGSCFPKDLDALLHQVYNEDKSDSFPLLIAVKNQNAEIRS